VSASSQLERVRAFLCDIEDRTAGRTVPVRGGVALFDDSIPNIWFANHVRLEAGSDVSARELDAEAERVQGGAGLQHRRITVYDPAAGRSLAPGLRALGWEVGRLLVMAHRDPPEARISTRRVREVKDDSWKDFRRTASQSEDDMDDETIDQMERAIENLIRTVGVRMFGATVGGVLASCCDLYSDGRTAQIEAVATLPEYRNRGLARAVVWRGVQVARRSGNDLVFLTTSADDWPRKLYQRLGFREAGYLFEFLKLPPSPDASAASRQQ
jgi:ribosomal protein S18 acetylase RimI-like enzyme